MPKYKEYTGETRNFSKSAGYKRRRRRKKLQKKVTSLVLSAALFGAVAGGTCYGINYGLETVKSSSTQTAQNQNTASPALQTVSTESALDADHLSVSDIAAERLPSVVSVTNISVQEVENYFGRFEGRGGSPSQSQVEETASCGSGIIIYADDSDYYMVTNYHVVEGATTLSVTFADDETYEAQLCGYDENTDLAVIKVSVSDLSQDTISKISIVDIGDSDDLQVGEQVVAIGNALGYGQSVTTGVVSAVNRSISSSNSSQETAVSYIQTDAAINPGNSGGALLNMNGELVGINTAKISSTDVEGIGYAIPISQVTNLINSLMQ